MANLLGRTESVLGVVLARMRKGNPLKVAGREGSFENQQHNLRIDGWSHKNTTLFDAVQVSIADECFHH
jgi:hypothetical protein